MLDIKTAERYAKYYLDNPSDSPLRKQAESVLALITRVHELESQLDAERTRANTAEAELQALTARRDDAPELGGDRSRKGE